MSPVRLERIGPREGLFGRAKKRWEREAEDGLDEVTDETLALYEKTVRTWQTRVRFIVRKTKLGRSVYTLSRTYRYVDLGTRPHIIRARRAPALRFKAGGKPKTKPGTIASYQGKPGTEWVSKQSVRHPGTEPRGFTDEIAKRMRKRYAAVMRKRIKDAFKGR